MSTTPLRSALRMSPARALAQATPRHIHSRTGALGGLVLLLALPVTVAFDVVFPGSAAVVIHMLLAAGTFIIALSVFDFAAPMWLTRSALGAACILAGIFFAQGLAALTQNEALWNVAFSPEVGGWGEALTVSMVMAWFIAIAAAHGRGRTMLVGVLSAAAVIGLSAWGVLAAPVGGTPAWLRLVLLVPIAWFVFVSARRSNT